MELDDDGKKAHDGKRWLDSRDLLENISAALWVDHGLLTRDRKSPMTLEDNLKSFDDLGFT